MWQRCIAVASGDDYAGKESIFEKYQFRLNPQRVGKLEPFKEAYLSFPTGDKTMLQYALPWPLHWIVTERDQRE